MSLSDEKVSQNMKLVLSSMDSFGLSIDPTLLIEKQEFQNDDKTVNLLDAWFDKKQCKKY